MKPTIRIDFSDFNGINKNDNFFTRILSKRYHVEISDRPDLLIYSKEGHLHRLYNCKKLFWSGETILPDFSSCDYAITTFNLADPRHLRVPYYVTNCACRPENLFKTPEEIDRIVDSERKFCSFVVSNGNPKRAGRRIDFFHALSRYKHVDSAGKALNNMQWLLPAGEQAKHAFLQGYKFTICFENKQAEGYTTEKLVDAMWARCIPIYWGNPQVGEEFNTKSFLSLNDFSREEELIERIIEVDCDDRLYREMLEEPYFNNNAVNICYDEERIGDFFDKILGDATPPISRRRKSYIWGRWTAAKMMK
ncbi:glycosyltransferase [Geobacter sp. FeAm09]|uniref:glycosyltransferase family 10 domain-containing protein n=1 Tax=Geobacter sp. FeAm09 TaxID=2597769 RepID=UPI0011EC3B4D|nr:glycosyltransferase family 10 [Geobacter sp. FeAm09]QEM67232.1 glycosyltransferase [Geobacter sp. FeAm09]